MAKGAVDGPKIRRLRQEHDPPLSQTELAYHLGVGERAVIRLEREGPDISLSRGVRLAALLGVHPRELLAEPAAAGGRPAA